MANYTITIYDLEQSGFDLGLKDYSIFDESYREILNNTILDYYRFREIGFQNPSVFVYKLNSTLDRIMRNKYNKLYKVLKDNENINPLYNVQMTETYNFTSKDEGSSASVGDGLNMSSSFPMSAMTEDQVTSNYYADNAVKEKQSTSDNINNSSEQNYTRFQEGSSAGLPFSRALTQYYDYIEYYRLDEKIIQELSNLFIKIY